MAASYPPRSASFGSHIGILLRLTVVLLLTVILLPAAHAQSSFQGKVIRVETGDRILVQLDSLDLTVQLHGIVCPVENAPASRRAREYTKRRVLNTKVTIKVKGTAAFQTVFGEVFPAVATPNDIAHLTAKHLTSLNEELAVSGLAVWAQAYAPNRNDIAELESAAKNERRGVWGVANGSDIPLPLSSESILQERAANFGQTAHGTGSSHPARLASLAQPVPYPAETPDPQSPDSTISGVIPMSRSITPLPTARPQPAGSPSQPPVKADLTPLQRTAIGLLATAFAAGCWVFAQRLWRREQILRAAVPPETAEPSTEDGTFVRATGRAILYDDILPPPTSSVGRIAGIYVREITQRYESVFENDSRRPGVRRRSGNYRWTNITSDTQTADFRLENDTGGALPEIIVEVTRAQFHPFRIARFYNDVPVENWFNNAYPGDTRTEIQYIPLRAEVTVWGRLHQNPDSPLPEILPHIGYDRNRHCQEIIEGDGERLLSGTRPLLGLLLTLAGLVFAGVTACAFFKPDILPRF